MVSSVSQNMAPTSNNTVPSAGTRRTSHNPRRRYTTAPVSKKSMPARVEFPPSMENALIPKPVRKMTQAPRNTGGGNTGGGSNSQQHRKEPAVRKSPTTKHAAVARKLKAVTPSRTVLSGRMGAKLNWTLTVDTPGGHTKIAIVRGVEFLDDDGDDERQMDVDMEDIEDEDEKACKISSRRALNNSVKDAPLDSKLLGSFHNSSNSLEDMQFEASTPLARNTGHNFKQEGYLAEGKFAKGPDADAMLKGHSFYQSHDNDYHESAESCSNSEDYDEDEAEDLYDESSLQSAAYRGPCAYFEEPPSPQHSKAQDGASDWASIGDDSAALRMQELLEVLSSAQCEDEHDEHRDYVLQHNENGIDDESYHNYGLNDDPHSLPPRQPVRTVSSSISPLRRQIVMVSRGGLRSTPSTLSRQSAHSYYTEGDDTIDDSQILPLSNLADQPWADKNDDEDVDEDDYNSTSESEEDYYVRGNKYSEEYHDEDESDDEYTVHDDESAYVRNYVEKMQMTKVDHDESIHMDDSTHDGESIQEYYQRDRVTAMLMAIKAREGSDRRDDETASTREQSLLGNTKRHSNLAGPKLNHNQGLYGGFMLDADPNDSANDESLTFLGSLHAEENIMEDHSASSYSETISRVSDFPSIFSGSLESPKTVSTRETKESLISSLMNRSLPSIEEDSLWGEEHKVPPLSEAPARLLSNDARWLDAVKDIWQKRRQGEQVARAGSADGKPRKPQRSVSMDSTDKVAVARATAHAKQRKPPPKKLTKPKATEQSGKPGSGKRHSNDASNGTSREKVQKPRPPLNAKKIAKKNPNPDFFRNKPSEDQSRSSVLPAYGGKPDGTLVRLTPPRMKEAYSEASSIESYSHGEMPPVPKDSVGSSAFVQLNFDDTDGVKVLNNKRVMDMDADDLREQEIIDRIERSKAKERSRVQGRRGLFGRRVKKSEEELQTENEDNKANILDSIWSFGGNQDFSAMTARNYSDMSALVEPPISPNMRSKHA